MKFHDFFVTEQLFSLILMHSKSFFRIKTVKIPAAFQIPS